MTYENYMHKSVLLVKQMVVALLLSSCFGFGLMFYFSHDYPISFSFGIVTAALTFMLYLEMWPKKPIVFIGSRYSEKIPKWHIDKGLHKVLVVNIDEEMEVVLTRDVHSEEEKELFIDEFKKKYRIVVDH